MSVTGRERKVDVNKLSVEQADTIAVQIGEKIKQITERAVAEANSFLKIYGVSCQMQIVIESAEHSEPTPSVPNPIEKSAQEPRKTRAKKTKNL